MKIALSLLLDAQVSCTHAIPRFRISGIQLCRLRKLVQRLRILFKLQIAVPQAHPGLNVLGTQSDCSLQVRKRCMRIVQLEIVEPGDQVGAEQVGVLRNTGQSMRPLPGAFLPGAALCRD